MLEEAHILKKEGNYPDTRVSQYILTLTEVIHNLVLYTIHKSSENRSTAHSVKF